MDAPTGINNAPNGSDKSIPVNQADNTGMRIEITPPKQPISTISTSSTSKLEKVKLKRKADIRLYAVIAIIAIAVASAFIFLPRGHPHVSSSITSTTSIVPISNFNGCMKISNPGTYYLSKNIVYSNKSGTCINVTASNVKIICNKNTITGSGPYINLPPFTYGIKINGLSNVSIIGCQVSKFSFGVYASKSSGLFISNGNFSSNFMSNIAFLNVSSSTVSDNFLSRSLSTLGSVYLANSSANKFINNNIFTIPNTGST